MATTRSLGLGWARRGFERLMPRRTALTSRRACAASLLPPDQSTSGVLGGRDAAGTSPRTAGLMTGAAAQDRQWSTPLAKQLAQAIATTGPISLASYMRTCLTADVGGYYTGALPQGRDQFGYKGDFVTSPEISQVFGELIGIWFVAEWLSQDKPAHGVEIIEVGPGRGTLMHDVLRTIRAFPAMCQSIDAIYMVEASPTLRVAQKNLLCGEDASLREHTVGYSGVCQATHLPIVWTETIKSIPKNPTKTPLIVAHEFFDALPIHAFQLVNVPHSSQPRSSSAAYRLGYPGVNDGLEWRELLVSSTPAPALAASPAASSLDPPPEFQLSLARTPTRHSLALPSSSARLRALTAENQLLAGSTVEICPDLTLFASEFAARIGGSHMHPKAHPSGAALVIDYGPGDGTVPIASLRGIRQHRRASPFSMPGLTDISADVDFTALAEAAICASQGVEVHGPVEQAAFLQGLGLRDRAEALMRVAFSGQGDQAQNGKAAAVVQRACQRLMDRGPSGMGHVYKALAILPENGGRRRPVGFGGDVTATF